METKLNLEVFNSERLSEKGLNASSVAKRLNVSRECVSKWLSGESLPKPDKLLQIGLLLGVGYGELVMRFSDVTTPIVHFRRKQNRKESEADKTATDSMADFVRHIAKFSANDAGISISPLENPRSDYEYAAWAADFCRKQLKLPRKVKSTDLVRWFNLFNINLIPAFWGDEEYYGNALRIFLPKEKSTWVILNLDSKVTDFLFWMAHELGHSLAPSLCGDEAETFADNFAQALLFPPSEADSLYRKIATDKTSALGLVIAVAKDWNISPYTVHLALTHAEKRQGVATSILPPARQIMGVANQNATNERVSQSLFKVSNPSPADFIKKCESWLNTGFFRSFAAFLSQNNGENPPITDLAHLLGISPDDAYGVIKYLEKGA